MKGYGKSKSASWFWILVSVGIVFGFFQWTGIGDESKNDLPKKGGGIKGSESKSAAVSGAKAQDSQCPKLNECLKEESPAIAGDLDRVSRAASVSKIYKIRCDLSVFDERELDILERYGVWMSELSRGEREPVTKEQQEFVVVCREFRVSSPEKMRKLLSGYEHALGDVQKVWLKYLFRLKVEGATD